MTLADFDALTALVHQVDALFPEVARRALQSGLRFRRASLACQAWLATGRRNGKTRMLALALIERRLDIAYELGRASVLSQLPAELRARLEAEDRPVGLAGCTVSLGDVELPASAEVKRSEEAKASQPPAALHSSRVSSARGETNTENSHKIEVSV